MSKTFGDCAVKFYRANFFGVWVQCFLPFGVQGVLECRVRGCSGFLGG